MLDEDRMPVDAGTGCLLDYRGQRFLMSVAHVTDKPGNWAVELEYEPGRGVRLWQTGAQNFLAEIEVDSGKTREIDYSYVIVDPKLSPLRQVIDQENGLVTETRARAIHAELANPTPEGRYGFCGYVRSGRENHLFVTEERICDALTWVGEDNGIHSFKLPFKHPGHAYFKGCSGAPIIDQDGRVVALVVRGVEAGDLVLGVSPMRYLAALDIEVERQGTAE